MFIFVTLIYIDMYINLYALMYMDVCAYVYVSYIYILMCVHICMFDFYIDISACVDV